jgi:hypothetical protein
MTLEAIERRGVTVIVTAETRPLTNRTVTANSTVTRRWGTWAWVSWAPAAPAGVKTVIQFRYESMYLFIVFFEVVSCDVSDSVLSNV